MFNSEIINRVLTGLSTLEKGIKDTNGPLPDTTCVSIALKFICSQVDSFGKELGITKVMKKMSLLPDLSFLEHRQVKIIRKIFDVIRMSLVLKEHHDVTNKIGHSCPALCSDVLSLALKFVTTSEDLKDFADLIKILNRMSPIERSDYLFLLHNSVHFKVNVRSAISFAEVYLHVSKDLARDLFSKISSLRLDISSTKDLLEFTAYYQTLSASENIELFYLFQNLFNAGVITNLQEEFLSILMKCKGEDRILFCSQMKMVYDLSWTNHSFKDLLKNLLTLSSNERWDIIEIAEKFSNKYSSDFSEQLFAKILKLSLDEALLIDEIVADLHPCLKSIKSLDQVLSVIFSIDTCYIKEIIQKSKSIYENCDDLEGFDEVLKFFTQNRDIDELLLISSSITKSLLLATDKIYFLKCLQQISSENDRDLFIKTLENIIFSSHDLQNAVFTVQSLFYIYSNYSVEFFYLLSTATHGVRDLHKKNKIMLEIAKISTHDRQRICNLALSITFESRCGDCNLFALKLFSEIPASEVEILHQSIFKVYLSLQSSTLQANFLRVLLFFSVADMKTVISQLENLFSQNIFGSNVFELLFYLLQSQPSLMYSLHVYLTSRLVSLTDSDMACELANDVINYHRFFMATPDTMLYNTAQQVFTVALDTKNIKNPYKIYKALLAEASIPQELTVKLENIEGKDVYVCFDNTKKRGKDLLRSQDLLDLCEQHEVRSTDLLQIVFQMKNRILSLNAHDQQVAYQHVLDACAMNFETLCQNFTDPYLLSLLDETYQEHISLTKGYFTAIVWHILQQSTVLSEGDVFSLQEMAILKMSTSIHNCSIGKSEGIALCYNYLDPVYKISSLKAPAEIPSVERAKVFIHTSIQELMNEMISSNSEMMKYLTQMPQEVLQLSHQSMFVKNMLAPHIGLNHTVQFDLHTHTLSDALVDLKTSEVLSVFVFYFTPSLIIDHLKVCFARSLPEHRLFSAITDLLDNSLPQMEIWNVDELSGKTELTNIGAMHALLKVGVLSESTSFLKETK